MDNITIDPISHASLILEWGGIVMYSDPVDQTKGSIFARKPAPDIILITDIHHDHFDVDVLQSVVKEKTTIFAPKAVVDLLPDSLKGKTHILNNGDVAECLGLKFEAIPMYNLSGPSEHFHTKGRGNGYVIEKEHESVYISGDTAGIPEMKNLKNIDLAFICINLPYTMDPEEAAQAVLAFKPKKVYPYHYRQNPTKDFADVAKFKQLVNTGDPAIEVVQLDWYPE